MAEENLNGQDQDKEEGQEELKADQEQNESSGGSPGQSQDTGQDLDPDQESDPDHVEDEIEDLKNSLLRLQADFNNYRKRTDKEKADIIKNANADLIKELLPVLDNFYRAFPAAEEAGMSEDVLKGFRLIQKDMISILHAQGLEEIKSDGEKFDPSIHQAIATEESDQESGIVLETLQKGYKLNDKVLRASIVKVSE